MTVREVILLIGPIPVVIPLNLFLDLLRDPVFPRRLTDSQSCPHFYQSLRGNLPSIGKNGDI